MDIGRTFSLALPSPGRGPLASGSASTADPGRTGAV